MGLILPQTIEIKISTSNYKHFRDKGYKFNKIRDIIEVSVLDLNKSNRKKVKCKCDYCGKEIEVRYDHVVENMNNNKLLCCNSDSCRNKKIENTCMTKYNVTNASQMQEIKDKKIATCREHFGVDYPFQSDEIKKKIKATCQKRFGCDYVSQSKEVKDKIKKTNNERYGGNSPTCSKEVQDKIKATNLELYGVENVFASKEIKEKIKQTMLENYGVEHPMHSEEIKNKIKTTNIERYGVESTLQFKEFMDKAKTTNLKRYGSENPAKSEKVQKKIRDAWKSNGEIGPCSKQQLYLANLLNGELNIPLIGYWADIILENEKIDLEYDGGAHRSICDFYHKMTSEEFDLRERKREENIYKRGYKTIRIISKKDKLPSDEVILNLIDEIKNFDFKVIRIDIDEGIINKDYTEKWNYNFGELRNITKKSLEKFGNNDNTLEK